MALPYAFEARKGTGEPERKERRRERGKWISEMEISQDISNEKYAV